MQHTGFTSAGIRIFIFCSQRVWQEKIASLLPDSPYQLQSFQNPDELRLAIKNQAPDLLLAINEADILKEIVLLRDATPAVEKLPLIVLSDDDAFEKRLQVIRAGAVAMITWPTSSEILISTIEGIQQRIYEPESRVLMVDDDEMFLRKHTAVLESHGMRVKTLGSYLNVMDVIDEFDPDLIVMDIYMPEYSGLELAKIIRLDKRYARIPIIYLSTEQDVDKQLEALSLGGDDFLLKPVDEHYLVEIVKSRIRRAHEVYQIEESLRLSVEESKRIQQAVNTHSIVSISDPQGNITYVNDKFCTISGYRRDQLMGQNHRILKSGVHDKSFYNGMWSTLVQGHVWKGEICNRSRSGKLYWTDTSMVPSLDKHGRPYQYISVRTDITKIKSNEKHAREAESRLAQQNKVLAVLATDPIRSGHDKYGFYQTLTKRAAEALDIGRVSIWLLDQGNQAIHCEMLYEMATNKWSEGIVLEKQDFPSYFAALESNMLIAADNAHTHQATAEFGESYLKPLNINSMLDAPVRRQGYSVGVVCLENTGTFHQWTEDELAFASSLADQVALHLESEELISAKNDAENANRAKSQFLSSMSHELRTPLNAIIGFSQLLQMDGLDTDQKENVSEIYKAGNHLLSLINEVLDLARVEAGRIEMSIEAVHFNEVVAECLSLITPLAADKSITLTYSLNGNKVEAEQLDAVIRADHTRFKQVMLNLLANAVKYNREHGHISIELDIVNDEARISVHDTGYGLTDEQQAHLFQAFNRLGAEQTDVEGTGIGLVITKKIIELMGGQIGVDSSPGEGSCFWVNVPLEVTQLHSVEPGDYPTDQLLAGQTDARQTVLYIEDNPANLRLVTQLLGRYSNISLLSAPEPGLGIELALKHKPDVILLDINLPGMNGFEVFRRLRSHSSLQHTRIAAVSANAMDRDIKQGLSAGFDRYITKPIDVQAFISTLNELLEKIEKNSPEVRP